MITNKGRDILAKYLIGQAPAYASYIAIGCGATPEQYTPDNVFAKDYVKSGPNQPTLTVNGLMTLQITIGSQSENYSIGKTIIVRGIDIIYDGIYTIIDRENISGNRSIISYNRVFENKVPTTESSPESIGEISPGISIDLDKLTKQNLDFEMFRVPIISRGYVTENNVAQVVFTAEMPTEERYEITEIGVYSAGANPSANNNDSKTLVSFSQSENWQYHITSGENQGSTSIPYIPDPLDDRETTDNILTIPNVVLQANANNSALISQARVGNKETLRFLNNAILSRGDLSTLTSGNIDLVSNHIHLSGVNLNLNTNALTDELRVAFSLVPKNTQYANPISIKLIIQFAHGEEVGAENAQFIVNVENFPSANRYFVESTMLKDLTRTSGFSWNSVQFVKVFVAVVPPAGSYTLNLISGTATGSTPPVGTPANQVTYITANEHNIQVGDVLSITGFTSTGFNLTNKTVILTPTPNTFVVSDTLAAGTSTGISGQTQVPYKATDYFIGLDAIRLENTTTTNALYGLTGYSVIRNTDGLPIVKNPNTSNLLEFRFAVGVE